MSFIDEFNLYFENKKNYMFDLGIEEFQIDSINKEAGYFDILFYVTCYSIDHDAYYTLSVESNSTIFKGEQINTFSIQMIDQGYNIEFSNIAHYLSIPEEDISKLFKIWLVEYYCSIKRPVVDLIEFQPTTIDFLATESKYFDQYDNEEKLAIFNSSGVTSVIPSVRDIFIF